jgi:hypothetical protein
MVLLDVRTMRWRVASTTAAIASSLSPATESLPRLLFLLRFLSCSVPYIAPERYTKKGR